MLSNDTQPAAIPGVVDGFLTVCPVAGHEVSFHIVLGPGPHPARIEFILSPDHAAAIREALDESTPAPRADLLAQEEVPTGEHAGAEEPAGVMAPGRHVPHRRDRVDRPTHDPQRDRQRRLAAAVDVRPAEPEVVPQHRKREREHLGVGQHLGRHPAELLQHLEKPRVAFGGIRQPLRGDALDEAGRDDAQRGRRQSAPVDRPRHAVRDERAHAVSEKDIRRPQLRAERLRQLLAPGVEVGERGPRMPRVPARQADRPQLDPRRQPRGPRPEHLRAAARARQAVQPHRRGGPGLENGVPRMCRHEFSLSTRVTCLHRTRAGRVRRAHGG